MKYFLILVSFLLLTAPLPALAVEGGVACTMEAKICPDGTGVSRTGPNCEFAPCPEVKPGSIKPEPSDLASCMKDEDCWVVPYSHCCGSTKRAINKAKFPDYVMNPAWGKFDDREKCAVMGACVTDKNVTKAHCARAADKDTGTCELTR